MREDRWVQAPIYEEQFVNRDFLIRGILLKSLFRGGLLNHLFGIDPGDRRQLTTYEERPIHPNEGRGRADAFRVQRGVVLESPDRFCSRQHVINFVPFNSVMFCSVRLAVASAFTPSGRGDGEAGGAAPVC